MLKPHLRKYGFPCTLLACFLLAGCLIAWQAIGHAVARERDEMLFSLHLRAESLAWATEAVARRLGHDRPELSQMLAELCRQPGIAWIAIVAPSGRILIDSNPELEGSLLYTPAELGALDISSSLQGRFSPDDPQIFETWKFFRPGRLRHTAHKRANVQQNIIFVALDARNFRQDLRNYRDSLWFMAGLALLFLACSSALLYFIHNYRISQRGMRDAKALSAQVVSGYPAPMLVTGLDGKILLANTAAGRKFGRVSGKIQELPGLDWNEIMGELAPGRAILGRELDVATRAGVTTPISLSAAVITDAAGNTSGYMFTLSELAEIKLLQRKLAEAERISAMGNLAAGVAHEIRNPLSSICGYASYLKNRLSNDPMGQATAGLLEEEAQRLNSALCDLLNLVKKPKLNIKAQSVDTLLEKIVSLIRPDADAKSIKIKLDLPAAGAQPFFADRDRLLQALLNLALNAIQAVPVHGQVEFSARFLPPGKEEIPAGISSTYGVWRITVSDNGAGMSGKVLKQIFTPYFTTRAAGTGLGLTLTRQIIEAHGGIITAASTPGRGATFTVFLPAEPSNK